MPRPNRVDPWGDLRAVPDRGMFTGNRGCLVDDDRVIVRHHRGSLWITCRTEFRDWRHPLDAPRRWTPLFFLDDAVALAAGHRPCALCRRDDYLAYRSAVTIGAGLATPVSAVELNRRLSRERLRRGGGLTRAGDRILWAAPIDELPIGTVIIGAHDGTPHLVAADGLRPFHFGGWGRPIGPSKEIVEVLTPPTSVLALRHGFTPVVHPSAVTPPA